MDYKLQMKIFDSSEVVTDTLPEPGCKGYIRIFMQWVIVCLVKPIRIKFVRMLAVSRVSVQKKQRNKNIFWGHFIQRLHNDTPIQRKNIR